MQGRSGKGRTAGAVLAWIVIGAHLPWIFDGNARHSGGKKVELEGTRSRSDRSACRQRMGKPGDMFHHGLMPSHAELLISFQAGGDCIHTRKIIPDPQQVWISHPLRL